MCLPVVFQEIMKTNSRKGITLKHNNASSNDCIFKRSKHRFPPNSPDLAPNDFCLFHYVKNKIRGQRFGTPEKAVDAFRMHVLEMPQSEWQKCFRNWFKRMQKCTDLNGEYFGKQ